MKTDFTLILPEALHSRLQSRLALLTARVWEDLGTRLNASCFYSTNQLSVETTTDMNHMKFAVTAVK